MIRLITARRLAALEDAARRLAALEADMAGTEETLSRVRAEASRLQRLVADLHTTGGTDDHHDD